MSEAEEYRCFIGNLSWSTTDESLRDAFEKFGNLTEAKASLRSFVLLFWIGYVLSCPVPVDLRGSWIMLMLPE
ncbi:hypothetical protein EJB05_54693 [Eragrostis curvula]|uniref:RRM domain-containing protein n=1 Tax=Eragrostis curvula TaxID=38414 RepID=A0A5J9SLS7_9POAL|nr:hypothetical protein EJB05_54693 [Eragrostis curvula]